MSPLLLDAPHPSRTFSCSTNACSPESAASATVEVSPSWHGVTSPIHTIPEQQSGQGSTLAEATSKHSTASHGLLGASTTCTTGGAAPPSTALPKQTQSQPQPQPHASTSCAQEPATQEAMSCRKSPAAAMQLPCTLLLLLSFATLFGSPIQMAAAQGNCPAVNMTQGFTTNCTANYNTDTCIMFSFCLTCDVVPFSIFSFLNMLECPSLTNVNQQGLTSRETGLIDQSISASIGLPQSQVRSLTSGEFLTTIYNIQSSIPSRVRSLTSGEFLIAIYNIQSSIPGQCVTCDAALESSFRSAFCSQLSIPSCSQVTTECVKGQGLPQQMARVHFLPGAAVINDPPCQIAQVATQVQVNPAVDNVQFIISLFTLPIGLLGYVVQSPGTSQVQISSHVSTAITNPSDSRFSPYLQVTDQLIGTSTASALGLGPFSVYASNAPWSIINPGPPISPPTNSKCDNPQLGDLCGQDAIGAIIGIVLGGLLVLALLLLLLFCVFRQKGVGSLDPEDAR
eukprot:gene7662-818_t